MNEIVSDVLNDSIRVERREGVGEFSVVERNRACFG